MNLREYQEKARSTAIYLDIDGSKMIYPAMGIMGECGEITNKIKKIIRDDNWEIKPDRANAIAKELGDCCWYLANICCDTNHDLSMMHEMRGAFIFHQIRGLNWFQLVLHMNRHAIALATALENWYYKHDCRLNETGRYVEIPNDLSHIITCIEEIAHRCNWTLEDICVANINNLSGRKRRGTLHGSGDNR